MARLIFILIGAAILAAPAKAQTPNCNQPASQPTVQIAVGDRPFSAIPSPDGCTIFVSLTGRRGASDIAVLTRAGGVMSLAHTVRAEGQLAGMALSHDGHFLVAANGGGATLFDAARLIAGADHAALGYLTDGDHAGSAYAAFSPDDHLLVISDERSNSLSVYDFAALLNGKTGKMIGQIRTSGAPVGLAFSPDGRFLYSTSEVVPDGERTCPGESGGPSHPIGGLTVIDAARAATDPANAVVARVRTACNSVRVALSPAGDKAYVSARGSDALLVFDTARLLSDGDHALSATLHVGKSPVGVLAAGGFIFVTNSDRFEHGENQSVSIIDANNVSAPQGVIPAGGFPRELSLTADGKSMLITNFSSGTMELIDLARLQEFRK